MAIEGRGLLLASEVDESEPADSSLSTGKMAECVIRRPPASLASERRFDDRQWTIMAICCITNVFAGMSYSLQAPFYPLEAQNKGIEPHVFGFVFGVFDLVNFLACPVYGRFIRTIGPKFMQNAGSFVMGSSCILFGLLNRVDDPTAFIVLSFLIRIVEALGLASYLTATYAIVSQEFTGSVATTFSAIETSFGVGMVCGPAAGGILYELGGFTFPFALIGSCLVISSIISILILPKLGEETKPISTSLLKLLLIPSIVVNVYANAAYAFSLGFINALLEPHLRQLNMTPAEVGFVFILDGGAYAFTAGFWGYLADKHCSPKLLCAIGASLLAISFIILGPAPFILLKPNLPCVLLGLFFHGLGTGGVYVVAFLDSIQESIKNGFPDSIETYGMVSGLWTSSLAFGNFLGPSVSGVLYDEIGFSWASLVVVGLQTIVVILTLGLYLKEKCCRRPISSNDIVVFNTETMPLLL